MSGAGSLNVNEWVQNCLQLSGYFLDGNAFALSQYCCAAVEQMLLQWHQKQQGDVAQAAAGGAASDQQQQDPASLQELAEQSATASATTDSSSSEPAADAELVAPAPADAATEQQQQVQQDGQRKDQAQKQQQQDAKTSKDSQQEQQQQQGGRQPAGSSPQLQSALKCLDEDVAANVCLTLGKLHLYTLVASHELHVEGRQLSYSFASPADVPDVLSFDALPGVPQLSELAWGDAALAASPDAALALFRAALPWFKEALQYYKLEGWVTEHCNILFEMSNVYRCVGRAVVSAVWRTCLHTFNPHVTTAQPHMNDHTAEPSTHQLPSAAEHTAVHRCITAHLAQHDRHVRLLCQLVLPAHTQMSRLCRCLAGFETDVHKRCVMHRSRAKLLQPLEGQLSQQHYPGLSRSISLELGNIFREIGDIKAAAGREPDKVRPTG
jgi:hypothetical protein